MPRIPIQTFQWEITSFSKNPVTSEGTVSYSVFNSSITRNQVSFNANNYFDEVQIVSSAFNGTQEMSPTFQYLFTPLNLMHYVHNLRHEAFFVVIVTNLPTKAKQCILLVISKSNNY